MHGLRSGGCQRDFGNRRLAGSAETTGLSYFCVWGSAAAHENAAQRPPDRTTAVRLPYARTGVARQELELGEIVSRRGERTPAMYSAHAVAHTRSL